MKFIPSRDLRVRPGQVWKDLQAEREIIVTRNGRPVALMVPIGDGDFEQTVRGLRQARMHQTIRRMQRDAEWRGADKLAAKEIDTVIRRARRDRRR